MLESPTHSRRVNWRFKNPLNESLSSLYLFSIFNAKFTVKMVDEMDSRWPFWNSKFHRGCWFHHEAGLRHLACLVILQTLWPVAERFNFQVVWLKKKIESFIIISLRFLRSLLYFILWMYKQTVGVIENSVNWKLVHQRMRSLILPLKGCLY